MCTQYYAPPTHRADSLAHRQSIQWLRWPTANLLRLCMFRKLPTQLNTPNIFVPDLVRVSPNASDVQRLGRCVPAFTGGTDGYLKGYLGPVSNRQIFLMGRQAICRCVCGNHSRYFKPCFADQVAFVPKPNQTISKSLWQDRKIKLNLKKYNI